MVSADEDRLQGIAQILVQEKRLDHQKVIQYQHLALVEKQSLQRYLISHQIMDASEIALMTAQRFGLPLIDLNCIDIEAMPIHLVSDKLIERHAIIPLFTHGKQLFLATDDPSKQASFKEIQFHTGLHPRPILVETDKLAELMDYLLHQKDNQGLTDYFDADKEADNLEISFEEEEKESEIPALASEDAPIVKFVNRVLIEAIKKSASDIHFEPFEHEFRIRYRQDGILYETASPPVSLSSRIAARLKIMSNLDISERRIPQDGRFKMKLSRTRSIDFRVSTCPTVGGEKVVMRILDPAATKLGVESLGFSPAQREKFLHAINRPQGMILVTGPTGSGKTVTLYSALNLLNTSEQNISTAEDPVEMKITGINQVSMNPKAGLTFSSTLRSFLRQDPDIIMVGEIRDFETAEIAVKAAQTGHLVLSTLHTNSAAETLTRLMNMGIPSYNIASSVSLIIAQRLIRRLCEHCKTVRDDVPVSSLVELGYDENDAQNIAVYIANGCPQCTNGYRGRIGLYEVMTLSKGLGRLIMSGGNSMDILSLAQSEGMLTIYQAGLQKVKEGITTLEEVSRVTVD